MNGVHHGYYQFRRKLIFGYAALAALLLGLLAWKISEANEAERQSALSMTRVIARSMAAHVAELIEAIDLPLRDAASSIGALPSPTSAERVKPLLSSLSGASDARYWLFFVDGAGVGVVAGNGAALGGVSFADRPYFSALSGDSPPEFFLGAPSIGRIGNRRVFFLSRRVVGLSGEWRGVVAAAIDAGRIAEVFELSRLNADMSITMAATDKRVIARAPLFDRSFGLDVAQAVAENGAFGESGSLEARSPIAGDRRLFSYARVGRFPMIVGVGLTREPWWARLRGNLGAAVAGLAAVLTVAWLSGKIALLRYWRLEEVEAEQRALLDAMRGAQKKLEAGERRLRAITENMPALVAYIDAHERFVFHNAADRKLTRYPSGSAQGKTPLEVYGAEIYEILRDDLRRALAGEKVKAERRYVDEGRERFFMHYYAPDFDENGRVVGCYAMATDITEFKQTQRALSALSRVDALTGLPNRVELMEKIEEALARCRRSRCAIACLYLDIDKFKEVNDTLGHAGGDAALIEFGRRLKSCVRQTDVVARIAGDEFVILLEGLEQPAEAERVALKIIAAMEAPFDINGTSRRVTTSVGAVAADTSADDADALLRKADAALYRAKRAGRNQAVSDLG